MQRSLRDSEYWDRKLSWASTAFFIGSVANASIKSILPIPDSLWGLMSALVGLGILLVFAKNFKEMLRRVSHVFWRSIALFLFLYMLSAVLISLRGETLSAMISGGALLTFAWWIPTGVFACSVYNKEILYNVWVKASYIISVFAIIIYFFHIPDKQYEELAEYNMSYGFYIILPLLIQIHEYQQKKSKWLLLLLLFEIFTLFVYASRGIMLSLIFFIVYKFAFESNSRSRKIFSVLFLIVLGFAMIASIQTIATIAVSILDSFGFESRTLGMLAEGTISETTGRDFLWKICFDMIGEKPILGWGIGGEYQTLANRFSGGFVGADEDIASCSPHNGIVQNFVEFGVLGGLISTLIIVIPLLRLSHVKDPYAKIMILVFCASRVIPNLVSGDGFFTEPKCAIYLYLFYFWKYHYRRMRPQSVKA